MVNASRFLEGDFYAPVRDCRYYGDGSRRLNLWPNVRARFLRMDKLVGELKYGGEGSINIGLSFVKIRISSICSCQYRPPSRRGAKAESKLTFIALDYFP